MNPLVYRSWFNDRYLLQKKNYFVHLSYVRAFYFHLFLHLLFFYFENGTLCMKRLLAPRIKALFLNYISLVKWLFVNIETFTQKITFSQKNIGFDFGYEYEYKPKPTPTKWIFTQNPSPKFLRFGYKPNFLVMGWVKPRFFRVFWVGFE